MQVQWEAKVGPAAVIGALGIVVQAIVVIWVGASVYTKTTDKIQQQSEQISEYRDDSNKRFQLVGSAIKETKQAQVQALTDVSIVKTSIAYLSDQIRRVEARLDGGVPPAPAIQPPKQ